MKIQMQYSKKRSNMSAVGLLREKKRNGVEAIFE